jgi:hypothetical protein
MDSPRRSRRAPNDVRGQKREATPSSPHPRKSKRIRKTELKKDFEDGDRRTPVMGGLVTMMGAPRKVRPTRQSSIDTEMEYVEKLLHGHENVKKGSKKKHARKLSSSSAEAMLAFAYPAMPTSTRQKPISKTVSKPTKTPISKRVVEVKSCTKPTFDAQSPFAGSFSLNSSFQGSTSFQGSAFTSWRTPSTKGMKHVLAGAKTAGPRMQKSKKKDASVFSSDGEEDPEHEFWNSPPAKTPKKQASPHTPQPSSVPPDWWLLSPFKGEVKTPMRRLMRGMDKVSVDMRPPLVSPSPRKGSISNGPTVTASRLNGEKLKMSASADPLRNFVLKSPTRQIRSHSRPLGQATASAVVAAAETTAAVSTIGGRVNARFKGKEIAALDPEFVPMAKSTLFPVDVVTFPDDVLARIFQNLSTSDLLNVTTVCKAWANSAVPQMWKNVSLRSTAGMWKLWSLMAGTEQVGRSKSIPGNLPPLPSDVEMSPMRRSHRIIVSTPPSKHSNPYVHHENTMILSPRLVHLPRATSPYFNTLLERSKSYRTFVESLSFRSIDADGKRVPMLRGPSLQILKVFMSNRKWFPNLRTLYLSGSAEWIDDELLEFISAGSEAIGGPHGPLRDLTLSGTRNLSREALMGWLPRIKTLERISIEFSEQVDDEVVETLVRNLPRLSSVRFPFCSNVTDRGVRSISEISSRLKEIDLSFCTGVTRTGISYLLHNAGTRLSQVEVGHIGATEFARPFGDVIPSSVRVLDLGGHDPLPLVHHLPRRLQVLRLQDCQQLTMQDVRQILDRCDALQTLDLSDCGQIDVDEVYQLLDMAKDSLRGKHGMESRLRSVERLQIICMN